MDKRRIEFTREMLQDLNIEMLSVLADRPTKTEILAHINYWQTVVKSLKTLISNEGTNTDH